MRRPRSLLAATGSLFALLMILVSSAPAHADEFDYIGTAIDAMQIAGAPMGVTITEDEKQFLKPLVRCLADSGANVTIAQCGKKMIAEQIPSKEGKFFATCMIDTADPVNCAKETALDQLDDELKGPARCALKGARLDECVSNEVLNRLPADEQAALRCLQRTKDPAACGMNYAVSKGDETFQKAWGKVKSDVGTIGANVEGPIKNIVDVAIGIRENDWAKVVAAGGAAVAKVAGRVVLKIYLGGVGDFLFGPAVDAAVDNRIGMVNGIINAAKSRDPGAVAEVLVASNFGYAVFVTCAVMKSDVPITGTIIVEGICATLGGAIMTAADVAGSIVNKIADLINFDAIAKDIERIAHDSRLGVMILLGEKSGKCKPVKDAYKDIYAKCYSRQAFLNLNDEAKSQSFRRDLHLKCRAHYLNCSFANDDVLEQTCRFLTEQYAVDTEVLSRSIEPEAKRAVAAKLEAAGCKNLKFDDAERTGLELACKKHLDSVFPPTGSIDTDDCGPSPTPVFGGPAYGLYEPICKTAVDYVEKNQSALCIASLKTQDCGKGRFWNSLTRSCTCSDGNLWDDAAQKCVNRTILEVKNPCTGGMKQDSVTRKCKCPGTQLWDGTRCKLDKNQFAAGGGPKLPGSTSPCTGGMRQGADGNCECPPATYWSGGACKASSPPIQGNDKDKFVFNAGTPQHNTGTETVRRCSGRRPNGTWPNCCPARTYYSNGMCRYKVVDAGTRNDNPVLTTPAGTKKGCTGASCCPLGTVYRSGICRRIVAGGSNTPKDKGTGQASGSGTVIGPRPCPATRPVGRPPYCCPVGTRYTMGACRRGLGGVAGVKGSGGCPPSRPNGRPPYCCPAGTNYANGACRRPVAKKSDRRNNYGGAAPACKSFEKRGSDGKCYVDSGGVR